MKFEELSLHPKLLSAIQEIGYTELTPIQEKSIPHGLEGKDIIGLAQTGTGKTVAFLIPVVHTILTKNIQKVSALVLAPTRELTIQIADEAKKLLKHSDGIRAVPIIGGTDYKSQNKDLEGLNGIIVATPGRLIDMVKSGSIDISNVEFFVLDEADRMLDMGFIQDIRWLLHKCKNRKQTLLFSATLSVEVMRLAYRFLNEPVEIQINPEKIITERIDQKIVHLGREEKIPYMTNLIVNSKDEGQGIIFTNYKANIPKIVYTLRKYGIPITGISSELDQKKRLRLLRDFKSGKYRYMVATDVASRGIDVENIDIVYNYDLPQDTENYVHRIGRTARAGRMGKAIGFCSESDYVELEKIEKYLKQKIEILEVNEEYIQFPTGKFPPFIGGDSYDREKEVHFKQNGRRPHDRGDRAPHKHDRDRRGDKRHTSHIHSHSPTRDSHKKKPAAAIQEAEFFLQKADSVLSAELKGSKSENKNQHRFQGNKGKQRQQQGGGQQLHKQQNRNQNKQHVNQNYDKSKRNLFDINDTVREDTKKKKGSIWQKIKSIFGR
ncbi:DEAD/DEAH box helicase [Leptospira borgpetersenii]|uniref:Superfamily II DNA and RNA helicase n=2 Tax=Leptospira borgpetersenii serovar Hardjo-bovis TaxID=338217 RepID=Q04Q15_LEPBJ|nr:DEAD/DEAH box helicase [Leptospira borgpetersenii]ABJ77005.1 Superfamily II DNA and RNA helicase [Leptospira borgpetersenii serovar Hardjo-bovis str. JB197]ABJ78127.1 Superfamily II DNA and RNA helicase [Leptospira borgpetersenii serovar Hardjo-bovis str. L550]AMX57325.1 DEAD/DEAH box helicase [Leptospira borgpetersenii serovar Hardjo]AMX60556.1 DEAD/DEAH box helicase [Leptospira borgpetersenii serovar Hardjo]AMX63802.1 DEAD/DEAH box helicase [Leptospira borgpetersenii serovar Hardjo]